MNFKLLLFFIFLFFISSCSSQQGNNLNHDQLVNEVMNASGLTSAIDFSSQIVPHSMSLLKKKINQNKRNEISKLISTKFNSGIFKEKISLEIKKSFSRKELLILLNDLSSKEWAKFNHPLDHSAINEKVEILSQQMNEGTFDYLNPRSKIVAEITDYAFLLNVVKITNSFLLDTISSESKSLIDIKRKKRILPFLEQELNGFHQIHVKSLFLNNYLKLQSCSEPEMLKVLNIRKNTFFLKSRDFFENYLKLSYQNFFRELNEIL